MELWVRSQDKNVLINTRRIDVDDNNIFCWDEGKYADEVYMGTYKSKERALEVLDEVQEYIEKQGQDYLLTNENGIITGQKHYGFVYQMPEE